MSVTANFVIGGSMSAVQRSDARGMRLESVRTGHGTEVKGIRMDAEG